MSQSYVPLAWQRWKTIPTTALHGLVLDGVYHTSTEGAPVFHPAPALTSEKLQALRGKIIARILRLLTREGHLVEEE